MKKFSSEVTKASIRSTTGCWTCRLRKKKCDESRPSCHRCRSANVGCYYGSKPVWIENGALAKVELERIKLLVAASADQKRAAFRKSLRAKPSNRRTVTSSPSPKESIGPLGRDVSQNQESKRLGDSDDRSRAAVIEGSDGDPKTFSIISEEQEADLIMHYLDHVFFIQFRFHTPSISAGGRGWLLYLLTRTKPLYHAALSLSAFHQQSLMLPERETAENEHLQELGRQHNLTLKELRVFIQANNEAESAEGAFYRNVQILACVVQLISFEVGRY